MSITTQPLPDRADAHYPDFQAVHAPVHDYLSALDTFLFAQVEELEPEIRDHVRYVLDHSGKRLRPILVAYSGFSGEGPSEPLVRLGAVIELVHLATLVHDDILDEADMRHRQETVATRYGSGAAVLVGDALFSHALRLAASFDTPEVCREVAQATARVCAGEISQTYRRGAVDFDRRQYFRVIELKTAELFAVSCRLGARTAGYSDAFGEGAARYGRHLGRAYQIFDDLVDLYADEGMTGKTLGTDLGKGKFTLPLLVLLEHLPRSERERLLNRFHAADPTAVNDLESRLADFPVIDEVARAFEAELAGAERAISGFETQPPYPHLRCLVSYVRGQLARVDHNRR